MRKLLSLLLSASVVASFFVNVTSASAACIARYPTIGTISSVSSQGNSYTSFVLDHADAYDASLFKVSSTGNIDNFNDLAKSFIQNNYQVPPKYVYHLSSYETADQVKNNLRIDGVANDSFGKLSWQPGDVIIMGPPSGGACSQYGFIAIFGQDGVIKSADVMSSQNASFTYGSETLGANRGADANCSTSTNNWTMCQVPITFVVNNSSVTVSPGETKSLGGTKFMQVFLERSSHTILPSTTVASDFTPYTYEHVLTFSSANVPPSPNPTPNSCPQLFRRLGRGSSGTDVIALQNYFISLGMLGSASATGYFGPLTEGALQEWQASHGIVVSGSAATTGWGAAGPRTRAALANCK